MRNFYLTSRDLKKLALWGLKLGWICSNPSCRKTTRGVADDESKYVNIGVAAHICATSEGGPRYDVNMTQEGRKSYNNGIWLCQSCSKLIDSDIDRYSVEILRQWKNQAEERTKEDLESQRNFNTKEYYTLKIKSFSEASKEEKLEQSVLIDLTDYFECRYLKDECSWGEINFTKESMSEVNVDSAVVISITRNIRSAAKEYIIKRQLPVGEIYYLSFQNPSIDSVKDGEHAWSLAKQIDFRIGERSTNNKRGKLHIFFAGPVSIMFQLGKMSLSYGKGCIYDFDLEKTGTYYPTISFLEDDWI